MSDSEMAEIEAELAPKITTPAKIALGLGLVPFVISFRQGSYSEVKVNGQVVESSKSGFDYVAAPVGALCLLLGIAAVVMGLKAPARVRATQLGAAAGAVLLGIVQLWRGLT